MMDMERMPPLGGMPPMGAKPPFDGPPPEMPEQDVSHMKNKRLDLRHGDDHPRFHRHRRGRAD